MSAKIETSIWLALKARINTLSGSHTKAWPGQTFAVPSSGTPPLPTAYLRIGRVSISPARQLIGEGERHERVGFLMITLVYPLGQDVSVYDQIAGGIAEHFKDGTKMKYGDVCVTVTSYPHVQDGYDDSGYWTVPVRIPWRGFI